eukprot:8107577-Pyramimonas_sp.AAC.1
MKKDIHDYSKTTPTDPYRTHEWLRQRVLDNLELHRLERNQHNLKNESSRDDFVICAAFKSG